MSKKNNKVRENRDFGEAFMIFSRDRGFVKPEDKTYTRIGMLEKKARVTTAAEEAGEGLISLFGRLFG